MTDAGRFRKRVVVERDDGTGRAASGAVVESWVPVAGPFFACVEPLAGRELIAAQQVRTDLTHKVTLRASAGTLAIQSSDRLRIGLRILNIGGPPIVDERSRFVTMLCNEGPAP